MRGRMYEPRDAAPRHREDETRGGLLALLVERIGAMPNFEVFTKRGSSTPTEPTVTLHKSGSMAMSKPAFDALGCPAWIELLFDRDERVMGIRPAEPGTAHAYPIRHTEGNPGQWLMSGLAFIKYYGLHDGTTRRYRATMDDGILCVDLKVEPEKTIGNRSDGHTGDESVG